VHNSRGIEKSQGQNGQVTNSNAHLNQFVSKDDQEEMEGLNLKIEQLLEEKDNLFHHL